MAPHLGNNGQLSRDERVQLYGIDCEDQVMWHEWTPGVESVQDLVLQNVALVTQKVKFKLPPTKEFDMPYPEPFKLAPGMKKVIPISFRPSKYVPHVDRVQIVTKGGSFFVIVKAVVKDVALSVPHFLDFGLCPTMERSQQQIDIYNTGTLKASMKWHARPPFTVRCPAQTVEVGQSVRCIVEFEPKTASVFDGLIACEVGSAAVVLDEEDEESSARVPEAKNYALQCTGVGKMPHLCVPGGQAPLVEFGAVSPGKRVPQTLELLNTTPVRAVFHVRALHDSLETAPLPPSAFWVSPESGVVEPNCTFTMTFYFQSHTVKEHACQRFQISTPGGTPLVVTCKAFCQPIGVVMSTRSMNFGEVPSGRVLSRTLQLENNSDRPAPYHFVNVDNQRGVFWLDRPMGIIPPDSFMVVTVFFGPMSPINYHKKVSCVVKGASTPLTLDLLGSAHNDKVRPARLEQHHVDLFRNMQLSGVREHQLVETAPEANSLDDELPQEELDPAAPEVEVKPLSATAAFLDLMLPTDSKLRDITISPANLDFGQNSVMSTSEKQTVTITNRTSQKVTVLWMIAGETRLPCVPDEKSLFSVYPPTCDIRPKGQMDFQVTFRPQSSNTVEGELLEVVVAQKINRTFRLVDLQRFTPPWTIALRGMGHTMAARTDTQVDISETNVRFKSCPPGERTYQVVMMTNPGDMPLSYQILPAVDISKGDGDSGNFEDLAGEAPFRAWPTQGIIHPHQFHLIVLEFAPTVAKNDVPYVANFQVVADYFESGPKTIRVSGRAWKPQLSFCSGQMSVTFPPTCSGIASTMVCSVKNVSEIPISYECRIPSRFRSTFWFTEPAGQLAPSESTSIVANFCPSSERVFSSPMYCATQCLKDPDNIVAGPLRALVDASTSHDDQPSYVLQLVGHGKGPALSLEPDGLDLGAVKACETLQRQVVILNSSQLTVRYEVSTQFVGKDPAAANSADEALVVGHTVGSVAGRCTTTLDITFHPPCRGEYVYEVAVTPKGAGSDEPSGKSVTFTLSALAQYPYVQIADLRTESATLQPQSMMWTQFQVDGINDLYQGEVVDVERKFQNAIGIDEKKRLVRQLKPFQLLFGTSAVESSATVVYLALSNPGYLPIRFSFQTPENLNLENVPYWCDEKALVDEREAHFTWVEEHGVYDIQPRTGAIAPGDFLHVKLTYHHHSIGTHILPVVFNVHDGRSVLFYLKGHSVAPVVGCLSVRSSVLTLQPVPLGEQGVVQAVELTNSGGVAAPWRVDLSTLSSYNAQNHNFEVLSVKPLEGTLDPQSSTFLHFTFRPLEAKRYTCPVRLEMLKDGRPSEELCFDIQADGYMPGDSPPEVEAQFPANLPIQTYAPVPGYGAALSIEILDFKAVPLRARHSEMLVLVNYTSDFVLSFRWDARKLFRFDHELEIEPSVGELSPGSHCIVVFRLCCDEPVDISGEIACHLDWTHISAYGQQSIVESQEDPAAEVEYFGFHADHIHEPARSKGQNAPVHISVANRLTVSRFRNLMSTAAGQKFLNENLHRTSVLSSHIPIMSPRRAMQTSTMGLALQSKEELPGMQSSSSMEDSSRGPQTPSAPTSYPLYVRLRAVVADWRVPPEEAKDFVVESSARNLLAQRESKKEEVKEEAKDTTNPGLNLRLEEPGSKQLVQRTGSTLSPAPEEEDVVEPPGQPEDETGNSKLVGNVLEHLMREVIAEEEFGSILDRMLSQDVPFFLQYEGSDPPALPPPDHPAAPEPALRPRILEDTSPSEESVPVPEDTDTEEDDVFVSSSSALPWSDLLLDFKAPPGTQSAPRQRTCGGAKAEVASPSSTGENQCGVDALSIEASSAPCTPEAHIRSWEEALAMYGEVDLDAFQDSAGEVLDRLLLDTMDDVIAGRLNWMRPLPRVRDRRL